MHPKIAVATDSDRIGSHGFDLLRNHPDIGLLAATVREAVVTKTIVEPTQQHDIVLQHNIRAAPTTATAAAAAESSTTAKAPAAAECGSSPHRRRTVPRRLRTGPRRHNACPQKA